MKKFTADRQPSPAVCRRGVMAAILLAGTLATQVADAEVGLTVGVEAAGEAPLTAVVTASAASDDAIVSYEWGLLPTENRCRQKSCEIDIPIASCRRVGAEVTTVLGETASDANQLCARGPNGSPPRVEIDVTNLVATARATRGSSRVVITRMWVDDRPPVDGGEPLTIADDGACHAVDALAVDDEGRVGFERRTVCTGPDAPRAWIGFDSLCPPLGGTQTICNEIDHPLGLGVKTSTNSEMDVDDCVTMPAPDMLTRHVLVGEDDNGRRIFAGAFACGAPAGGPPRLFFAEVPEAATPGRTGRSLTVRPSLYGGSPPFDITVRSPGILTTVAGENSSDPRIEIRRLPVVGAEEVVDFPISVSIVDADGLRAEAEGIIQVAGEMVVVVPPGTASSASGCTTAPPPMTPWLCLIALGVFVRRRK